MTEARIGLRPGDAADWLSLAAAPAFAVMALLTGLGDGRGQGLCTSMPDASPLGGMAIMYALMAIFHLPRWLRRPAEVRNGERQE